MYAIKHRVGKPSFEPFDRRYKLKVELGNWSFDLLELAIMNLSIHAKSAVGVEVERKWVIEVVSSMVDKVMLTASQIGGWKYPVYGSFKPDNWKTGRGQRRPP